MNIFLLHQLPHCAAALHCDTHLAKMILESLQILYTVIQAHDLEFKASPELNMYKPTHGHHPCTLWVGACRAHAAWLLDMALELCIHFERFSAKRHACEAHLRHMRENDSFLRGLAPSCSPLQFKHHLEQFVVSKNKEKIIESTMAKVSSASPPLGCEFGVVAIGDELWDGVVARDERGDLECVESYRRYYAHKAKRAFPMLWLRQSRVPVGLRSAFAATWPDEPALLKPISQPARKRPADHAPHSEKRARRAAPAQLAPA